MSTLQLAGHPDCFFWKAVDKSLHMSSMGKRNKWYGYLATWIFYMKKCLHCLSLWKASHANYSYSSQEKKNNQTKSIDPKGLGIVASVKKNRVYIHASFAVYTCVYVLIQCWKGVVLLSPQAILTKNWFYMVEISWDHTILQDFNHFRPKSVLRTFWLHLNQKRKLGPLYFWIWQETKTKELEIWIQIPWHLKGIGSAVFALVHL